MKNKFYIKDTTIKKIIYFNTTSEVVSYLERLIKKTEGKTRSEYMQHLSELGYGYDDSNGISFTRAMAEKFEIGYINSDGNHVRTDVHNISSFNKEEYGD
jgi:hypothetical protein